MAWRKPAIVDEKRIDRLIGKIGKEALAAVTHPIIVAAANEMHPTGVPATLNREVMRPAAAILHYSAGAGYCPYLRLKLFKEPRPKTRAVSVDTAELLVRAAPVGSKRLLLLWLFGQGMRISDTLRIEWSAIDLPRQVVRVHISKVDLYVEKPLAPEVFEALAAQTNREGRLFPWRTKSGVYSWLRPLADKIGVKFTPHMARHSVGTWLNAEGAGLRTIMGALDHADPKSSVRYQTADVEIIRAAKARLPRLLGGDTGEPSKTAQKA